MTARQKEIIDTAIEIIAEKGIQNLTIKNLSKAIKITEPAIYRHFESKTEILMAMLDNLNTLTQEFSKEIFNKEIDPIKKLEKIIVSYFKVFAEHPYWVSVIFADEIFKNDKALSKKIQDIVSSKEEIFIKIISQAQKQKLVRKDVTKQHLAIIIMGSLRLLIKRWELTGFSFDLLKEGKKLQRSILQIIKP